MNPLRTLFPNAHDAPAAVGPATAPAAQPSARDAIVQLLELEGCKPRVDKDGDVVFVHRQLNYLLLLSAQDPEFVRLVLPNFCAVGSEAERAAAYEAANVANATCKAAKVTVEHGQTHAAVECFLASPHHFVPVLMRCAGALEHAARSFGIAYTMIRRH